VQDKNFLLFTILPRLHPVTWAMDILDPSLMNRKNAVIVVSVMWAIWTNRNKYTHGEVVYLLDIVHILELYCTSTCNTLVIPLYILSIGRPKRHEPIPTPIRFLSWYHERRSRNLSCHPRFRLLRPRAEDRRRSLPPTSHR
jgi:hypothetical protein